MFSVSTNMKIVNTKGKNFMPSVPAVRADGRGDEFVGQFRGRLQPRRHQRLLGGGADQEQGQPEHCDQHEQRRIGEGDLGVADLDDREQLDDAGIGGSDRRPESFHHSRFLSRTTPAARITLRTPAAKPSSRNTISPHGEIPSQRSSSQPISAPTRTPATSSVESRKPRANPEALAAAGRGPVSFSDARLAVSSRLPRRWSLAERAASSSGGSLRSPCPRLSSAMLSTCSDKKASACPAALKAARTLLIGSVRSQETGIWRITC